MKRKISHANCFDPTMDNNTDRSERRDNYSLLFPAWFPGFCQDLTDDKRIFVFLVSIRKFNGFLSTVFAFVFRG